MDAEVCVPDGDGLGMSRLRLTEDAPCHAAWRYKGGVAFQPFPLLYDSGHHPLPVAGVDAREVSEAFPDIALHRFYRLHCRGYLRMVDRKESDSVILTLSQFVNLSDCQNVILSYCQIVKLISNFIK